MATLHLLWIIPLVVLVVSAAMILLMRSDGKKPKKHRERHDD